MGDNRAADGRDDDVVPGSAASSDQISDQGEAPQVAPEPEAESGEGVIDPRHRVPAVKQKRVKPLIDLDEHIRDAQQAMKAARKQVLQARAQAKLEKRKKQRLMRKASALNVDDLERIAVLKRCALMPETTSADSKAAASSCSGSGPSAAAPARNQENKKEPCLGEKE